MNFDNSYFLINVIYSRKLFLELIRMLTCYTSDVIKIKLMSAWHFVSVVVVVDLDPNDSLSGNEIPADEAAWHHGPPSQEGGHESS